MTSAMLPTPTAPATTTVSGLLEFCALWLDEKIEAEQLLTPCIVMSQRLRQAAQDMERVLHYSEASESETVELVLETVEAYERIAQVLDALPEMAYDEAVDAFEEALLIFEEERELVLECNEILSRPS